MAPSTHQSRILEITLISAQDLAPVSKTMKAYAIAWVDPDRKLATRVDQTGFTDPMWNDKFVFRVDEKFLRTEDAAVEIEIYAAAWVKDALIGHVKVLIADLFTLRSDLDSKVNNAAMRVVSLHVRRPSGRPQGILTMGVALLDSTMRSLPIYDSYSSIDESSAVITDIVGGEKYQDERINKRQPENPTKIRRSQSDKTDLTTEELVQKSDQVGGSIVNGGNESACNGDSMVNGGSEVSSDVGPSASVVAAAIAKGLYRRPAGQESKNSSKADGLNKHLQEERRRTSGLPPRILSNKKSSRRSSKGSRRTTDDDGSFTCLGKVFGCEISISCGGRRKKKNNNKVCNLSSVVDNDSQ